MIGRDGIELGENVGRYWLSKPIPGWPVVEQAPG